MAFGVGLLAIVGASTFAPSYEDCSANYSKHYTDPEKGKAPPEVHRTFTVAAIVFAECEGEFIHTNEGVITALSTIFIALFTLALWRSTDNLWEAGERQLRLAEKQFVTTNRPRVIVRFVQGPVTDPQTTKISVIVTFANIGPSDATVFAIGCDVGIRRGSRWRTSIDGEARPISPLVLASGQRHIVEVEAREEGDGDDSFYFNLGFLRGEAEVAPSDPPHSNVCVIGEVRYRDAIGVERHTGFLRIYDFRSGEWIPDDDLSQEYED